MKSIINVALLTISISVQTSQALSWKPSFNGPTTPPEIEFPLTKGYVPPARIHPRASFPAIKMPTTNTPVVRVPTAKLQEIKHPVSSVFVTRETQRLSIPIGEKIEMFRESDVENMTKFLNPETSDLIREYHDYLNSSEGLHDNDPHALAGTVVSLALFVAARVYGNYIRGNGMTTDIELPEIHEENFDLDQFKGLR